MNDSRQMIQTDASAGERLARLSNLYTSADVEAAIKPALLAEYALDSEEWRAESKAAIRAWRRKYWLRQFGLIRSEKSIAHVRESYELNWTVTALPSVEAAGRIPCVWNGRGLYLTPYAEKRVHILILHRILNLLAPQRVLEVGSGNGVMALLAAGGFQSGVFQGLELTDAGIAMARSAAGSPEALRKLADFAPYDFDAGSASRVEFIQGSAADLPFDDASQDIVYTSLALEQMDSVMTRALAEIRRVTAGHAVMIEPFGDANRTPERRYFTGARDYFSLKVSQLRHHGFEVVQVYTNFPAKLTRGVAVVVARPLN
jgi:ubiquinone/menaquinone biosynthesis C-methylase UbiE